MEETLVGGGPSHCTKCDPVGTDQCPDLKQYYSQIRSTTCGRKPTCRENETKCQRYDCGLITKAACCQPANPDHISHRDWECCTGIVSGNKKNGYCNAESCPFSDYCNSEVSEVCKLTGNINLWFDSTGCSSYVADSTGVESERVQSGGRKVLRDTMQNFFPDPYSPNVFNQDSWSKRVKVAQENCQHYPDECKPILENFCRTVTRKDVFENDDLKVLCGCYMPEEQYPYRGFISLDCSTTCNGIDNIQPKDWNCDQTVCIIDNVTINEVDSEGNINLSQICGGGQNSVCLLKDININQVNSKVGDGVHIDQQCRSCYNWIGGNNIDSESVLDENTPSGFIPDPTNWQRVPCAGRDSGIIPRRYLIFIGVGVIILIILILIGILIWALY